MKDIIAISTSLLFLAAALLFFAGTLMQTVYGGHEECIVWNWGCKWVDNESECVKGEKPIRTDTYFMTVPAGKSFVLVPVTDEDYLYNCTRTYDNGTVVKYQEVE